MEVVLLHDVAKYKSYITKSIYYQLGQLLCFHV